MLGLRIRNPFRRAVPLPPPTTYPVPEPSMQVTHRAVVRAARLLDRIYPRWYDRVDLTVLDMTHAFHCVLGQLYASYADGLDTLWNVVDERDEPRHVLNAFSWYVPEAAWRDAINARRREDAKVIV